MFLIQKLVFENEIPTPINLMITFVLNTKNREVENEIFDNS